MRAKWRRRPALELKTAARDKPGPVFASGTGGRLAHRNLERRGFDAAADDAKIEDVILHDLRHAYQRFNGPQADERIREAMSG